MDYLDFLDAKGNATRAGSGDDGDEDKFDARAYAEELIELNPTSSDSEIRNELLAMKDPLSVTEINALLAMRLIDDDVRFEAEELVADMVEALGGWKRAFMGREKELEKAKEAAKADIRKGGIIIIENAAGEKKEVNLNNPDTQARFIKMIDELSKEDVFAVVDKR